MANGRTVVSMDIDFSNPDWVLHSCGEWKLAIAAECPHCEEENQVTNHYTPEDVPTVLRRMFSDAIKLGESWEADGNKDLSNFEHGKFITESLDEWAYNFSLLAGEYESLTTSTSRREWRDSWKDYTDDLAIPEDWEDITWHNNELPSFIVNGYHIWINSPRAEERKENYTSNGWNPDDYEDWRFVVNLYNEEDAEIIYPERCSEGHGHLTGGEIPNCSDGTYPDVLRTLDFDELVAFVSKSRT